MWVFPKIGVPQNGWFITENPIKMDDLGVHLFLETSICVHHLFNLISSMTNPSGKYMQEIRAAIYFCVHLYSCSFDSYLIAKQIT